MSDRNIRPADYFYEIMTIVDEILKRLKAAGLEVDIHIRAKP